MKSLIKLAGASLVAPSLLATGLSAYDASYLWLARDLDVELVTLDRQLAKAAVNP
jgi:predicted nucleic acid-binding protein